MQTQYSTATKTRASALSTNRVLRNTYLLLSMTLLFSAMTAGYAMFTQATIMNPLLFIVGYIGLLFLTQATSRSAWGLVSVFALTGFMGYTLGPILNAYINGFNNGSQLVMTALGATAFIFLALSAYAVTTRKDFSYLGGFLFAGAIIAMVAVIASFFIPAMSVLVSAIFMLISSGFILFQTSLIVRGGETNYILATVNLYVSIYNLFLSLLRILAAFNRN